MTIVIRHCNGETLYTSEAQTLAKAVEEAVAVGTRLIDANLNRANLTGADLSWANLTGAKLNRAYLADAYLIGANLTGAVLTGADLSGADLRDANLSDAYLHGAYLHGADLHGANLHGAKIVRVIARIDRLDGYEFIAFETDNGLIIRAGCRTMSPSEYRDHVAREYPNTDKAEETLAILDYIESRAVKLCAPVEPAKAEAR
jgi:uncharacterized protein YjbI with pentapeptide repeats